uniref:UPAR/Ly6 domain-containing protein n=1 Tax=Phasianus colchicus TaxID=9054 RepID=A0A669NYT7_PHACC
MKPFLKGLFLTTVFLFAAAHTISCNCPFQLKGAQCFIKVGHSSCARSLCSASLLCSQVQSASDTNTYKVPGGYCVFQKPSSELSGCITTLISSTTCGVSLLANRSLSLRHLTGAWDM